MAAKLQILVIIADLNTAEYLACSDDKQTSIVLLYEEYISNIFL